MRAGVAAASLTRCRPSILRGVDIGVASRRRRGVTVPLLTSLSPAIEALDVDPLDLFAAIGGG